MMTVGLKIDRTCEHIIIALLLAVVVGVPLFFDIRIYSVFDLSKVTALYLLVTALVVVYSVRRMAGLDNEVIENPLFIPIMCFAGVAYISTCLSIYPLTSLLGGYKRYAGLLSLLCYMIIFMAVVRYLAHEYLNLFIFVMVVSASLTCVYGLAQYAGHDPFAWNTTHGYYMRIQSVIGHPAFYSAYLIMILPLVSYMIFKSGNIYTLCLYTGCLVLFLVTFYLTKTRATFIGMILSNIFFFTFLGRSILSRNRFKAILIICVIFCVSVIYNVRDHSPVKRIATDTQGMKLSGTMATRYYNILVGIEIIRDYPFFGIGLDNIGYVFPHYITRVYEQTGATLPVTELQDRVHSDFFDIGATLGIPGICCYLYCICAYVTMIWKSRNENRLLIAALSAGVFSYFIQNQFSFGHIPIFVVFWVMLGMSVIACRTKS